VNAQGIIPIYELVNYNLDDGLYEITLIPEGVIFNDEGEQVSLPDEISFEISVVDDRAVGIIIK